MKRYGVKRAACLVFIFCTVVLFPEEEERSQVKTQVLEESENANRILYGARVEPIHEIIQHAPISGIIDTIYVEEGSIVRKDQVLLTIRRSNQVGKYKPVYVKALTNGVVVRLNVEESYEVYEKSDLLTLADTSSYKSVLWVSDKDISLLHKGLTCFIKKADSPEKVEEVPWGTVKKIAVLPNEQTGLFEVEVVLPRNPSLFPGKFVTFLLKVNHFKGIILDLSMIKRKYGKNQLYVLRDTKVYLQEVILGQKFGKMVAVIEGVSPGDTIVTWSDKMLYDGMEVEVVNDKQEAEE